MKFWQLVFSIVICAMSVQPAFGQCDCVGTPSTRSVENYYRGNIKSPTAHEEAKNSYAVFMGEVIGINKVPLPSSAPHSQPYELVYLFRVHSAWKSPLPQYIALVERVHNCLIGIESKQTWLVYALRDEDGGLRIEYCSGSRPLARAAGDLADLKAHGFSPVVDYSSKSLRR